MTNDPKGVILRNKLSKNQMSYNKHVSFKKGHADNRKVNVSNECQCWILYTQRKMLSNLDKF